MPLSDQCSVVTRTFNERGYRRMFAWYTNGFHAFAELLSFCDRFFKSHRQPRRIASGYPSDAGRGADRSSGVGICKFHPVRRKLIQIWSFVIRPAITAKVAPAHIIGENE